MQLRSVKILFEKYVALNRTIYQKYHKSATRKCLFKNHLRIAIFMNHADYLRIREP